MKKVFWKGDFSNEPKSGFAKIVGDNAHIEWEDGSKNVTPLFTMVERYGWTVIDA